MKSRVRAKMLMAIECGTTAEENLSEVDRKIYDMYPHIPNFDQNDLSNEHDKAAEEGYEVIADLDLPVVNDSISKESHKDVSQGFGSPNQEPNTETIDDSEDTARSMELMPQKSLMKEFRPM